MIANIFSFILTWLDVLVPRWITEEVGMGHDEHGWYVICPEKGLLPEDEAELVCIGVSRGFNLFGFMICVKVVIPEEFENYGD